MNRTVSAIFENGILRPLQHIELDNGEEVEVLLLKKSEATAMETRSVISKIADLPLEGEIDDFSGADHDSILYRKP